MTSRAAVASLAMYPLPPLRSAADQLWVAVRRHLDGWPGLVDIPAQLEWTVLTPEVWSHPQLLLAQMCGWPLVAEHAERVVVLGTFDHDVPGADAGHYRSVIVTPHDATLAELQERDTVVAAVNSFDSLSGWISLQHVWGGRPDTLETGAHLESVRALATGTADVASIDAVSWAVFTEHEPQLTDVLRVIGSGPRVPCLPLVTGWARRSSAPALRAALTAAVADDATAAARRALHIRSFVPMELADYLWLPSLLD